MDRPLHVVGGGIAGLVAAITAAEAGAPVVLYESAPQLGGRALGGAAIRGVNLGPRVVCTDGAVVRWLRAHDIPLGLRPAQAWGVRLLDDGGPHLPVWESLRMAPALVKGQAPIDASLRDWADSVFGPARGTLICRLAGLFTYHHDPGSLSARFVWDRYRRTLLRPDRVRWIAGGWAALVDALVERATAAGVQIETGHRMGQDSLPDGPTIVATKLAAAGRLLGRELRWPGTRTALVDVVAEGRAGWPSTVADVRSDLATCCMIGRETAVEPGLAGPGGVELFQAQLGIDASVPPAAAIGRIEDALDAGVAEWRPRTRWRRGQVVVDATGAVDPPGTTWRDRPAIDQGDDRFLAGDAVAAPGMLSEVAVNSGVKAAQLALAARRRRAFAVGWPAAELTAERRLAVLAAVLPAAAVSTTVLPPAVADRWVIEPVDERGPSYRLTTRRGMVRAATITDGPDGARLTTLVSSRWPAGPLINRLAAKVLARWPRPAR